MPRVIGLGDAQPYSRGELQEKLYKSASGVFPEFPPESPSRTGVTPCVAKKLVLCVPLLHCWRGSCGRQIQANVRGNVQQMLVGRHNPRLLAEAGSRAPAAPGTRKP